jgi:hypothetical protein
MVVETGKVREFARATKSRNPAYDPDVTSPPYSPATFLMAASFWQKPENDPLRDAGRNLERILHGEQEFVFYGSPPRAGAVLTGESRIERVYQKAGKRGGTMTFTDQWTEFRDSDGRLVAEVRSTTLETSKSTSQD